MTRLSTVVLALVTAVILLGIGALVATDATLALVAALGVLLVGLAFYQPLLIPVLAMPALVIVQRVGVGGVDLSLSDFALFGAFWVALVFAPRPLSPAMRTLLWVSAVYQVATLFTVLMNPYLANTVEWFHAWLSVGGALVVGWAVGASGRARLGLTLLLIPCLAIALLTVLTGAQQLAAGNTGPVYLDQPIAMHKNFIGAVLGIAALLAYARPLWVAWPRWFALGTFWLCALGVVASQARQALVGLAVAILLVALRRDPDRRRNRIILVLVPVALYFVVLAVQEQLASDGEHDSASQRLAWYGDALDVWERSPWFGMGLRWWTSGRTEFVFQPPNAELEVLSSAGIVGLAGFLVMFAVAFVVLWRLPARFGTLAVAVLLMRFITGQFDLFWVAVQVSLPFTVIGICLGVQAWAERRGSGDIDGDAATADPSAVIARAGPGRSGVEPPADTPLKVRA